MSRGRRFAVFRQHAPKKLDLLFRQPFLVLFRIIGPLASQERHHRIAGKVFFIHPGQLRKHLKIAPVAFSESLRGALTPLRAHPSMKFDVARPARQKIVIIQLEGAHHDFSFVFGGQVGYRSKSGREPGLVKLSGSVFLELRSQRRNNVEGRVHARKFLDHPNHAPIILERVKSSPRKHISSRRRVAILRLMHVPQHHQVYSVHRRDTRADRKNVFSLFALNFPPPQIKTARAEPCVMLSRFRMKKRSARALISSVLE